ncbi:hypothetical protein FOL47_011001 [Perkinsus chesapeaki]|uniref:Uncharacterized protein n=1 Tax=Perkinsus chesapeaki TaxID=330153 RepID=A0A7J6L089_PERCH|nr:hypothetical protein FOL47_011001 [Perkinsus chesapeaki]
MLISSSTVLLKLLRIPTAAWREPYDICLGSESLLAATYCVPDCTAQDVFAILIRDDRASELELIFHRLGEATTTAEDGINEGKTSAEFRQLNSVFTSITNSIAWSSLRAETYEILFRQDAVLASLFRNYLLAQRLLSLVGVSSVSRPQLPDCSQHPLWEAWDFVLESSILHVVASEANRGADLLPNRALRTNPTRDFFNDQLRAFSVWLRKIYNKEPVGDLMALASSRVPLELPILLQVLSHSVNRLCSLKLLAVYCDLGKSEITLCLNAGLLPYLQKLLPKTSSTEASELVLFLCAKVVALECYEKSTGVPVSKATSSIFSASEYRYVLRLLSSETIDSEYRTLGCLLVAMLCQMNPEIKRSNYQDLRAVEKLYRCLVSPHGGKLHAAALLALAVIFTPSRNESIEDTEWAAVVESRLITEFSRTPGLSEIIARSVTGQDPSIRSAALLLVSALLAIFGDRDYLADSTAHLIEIDKENVISVNATQRVAQQLPEAQIVKKGNASCSAGAVIASRAHRRGRRRRARSRGGRTKKNGDLVHDLQSKASQCGMFFQNLSTAEYEKSLQNVTKASAGSQEGPAGAGKGGPEFLCKLQEVSEDGSVTQRSALCRQWLLDLLKASDKVSPLANEEVLKRCPPSALRYGNPNHFHASTSIDFSDVCESIPSPSPCRSSSEIGEAVTAAADLLIHSPQLASLDWFKEWQDPFGRRSSASASFAPSDEMSCPESRPLLTAWNCATFLDDSPSAEQDHSVALPRPVFVSSYHGG